MPAAAAKTFTKPLDNIGAKSIPNYATYAAASSTTSPFPAAATPGRVFVGQRQDPFVVNLGETFDLVNIKYPVEELATCRAKCAQPRAEFPGRLQRHLASRWKSRPPA